jgi:coronin-1B/1C/6
VTKEAPFVHYINTYQTSDPQRGIGMMPKRGCDTNTCEIGRFYRLNNNGFCQVVSMTVPRKSELFQEDLYPDTASDTPAITADEWAGGMDAMPTTISLRGGFTPAAGKKDFKVSRKPNILDKDMRLSKTSAALTTETDGKEEKTNAAPAVKSEAAVISEKKLQELADEVKKLKAVVVKHENRIRDQEKRLKEMEELLNDGLLHEPEKSHNHTQELAPDEV